jgi:hypothetical protein
MEANMIAPVFERGDGDRLLFQDGFAGWENGFHGGQNDFAGTGPRGFGRALTDEGLPNRPFSYR